MSMMTLRWAYDVPDEEIPPQRSWSIMGEMDYVRQQYDLPKLDTDRPGSMFSAWDPTVLRDADAERLSQVRTPMDQLYGDPFYVRAARRAGDWGRAAGRFGKAVVEDFKFWEEGLDGWERAWRLANVGTLALPMAWMGQAARISKAFPAVARLMGTAKGKVVLTTLGEAGLAGTLEATRPGQDPDERQVAMASILGGVLGGGSQILVNKATASMRRKATQKIANNLMDQTKLGTVASPLYHETYAIISAQSHGAPAALNAASHMDFKQQLIENGFAVLDAQTHDGLDALIIPGMREADALRLADELGQTKLMTNRAFFDLESGIRMPHDLSKTRMGTGADMVNDNWLSFETNKGAAYVSYGFSGREPLSFSKPISKAAETALDVVDAKIADHSGFAKSAWDRFANFDTGAFLRSMYHQHVNATTGAARFTEAYSGLKNRGTLNDILSGKVSMAGDDLQKAVQLGRNMWSGYVEAAMRTGIRAWDNVSQKVTDRGYLQILEAIPMAEMRQFQSYGQARMWLQLMDKNLPVPESIQKLKYELQKAVQDAPEHWNTTLTELTHFRNVFLRESLVVNKVIDKTQWEQMVKEYDIFVPLTRMDKETREGLEEAGARAIAAFDPIKRMSKSEISEDDIWVPWIEESMSQMALFARMGSQQRVLNTMVGQFKRASKEVTDRWLKKRSKSFLYHGSRYDDPRLFIQEDGSLLLKGSENFDGKQRAGVSFSASKDVALKYSRRVGSSPGERETGGFVFEIDKDALPSELKLEGLGEAELRSNGDVIIPEGKFRVHYPGGSKIQKWETNTAAKFKAMSDKDLVELDFENMMDAETREFHHGGTPRAPSDGISSDLVAKYGDNPEKAFVSDELVRRVQEANDPELAAQMLARHLPNNQVISPEDYKKTLLHGERLDFYDPDSAVAKINDRYAAANAAPESHLAGFIERRREPPEGTAATPMEHPMGRHAAEIKNIAGDPTVVQQGDRVYIRTLEPDEHGILQPNWWEIKDKELWDSLKFLGPSQVNKLVRFGGLFSALQRVGVTTGAEFLGKNVLRDIAFSFITAGVDPFAFTRGAYTILSSKLGNRESQELFDRFLASGAARAALVSVDRPYLRNMINEATMSFPKRALHTFTHPIQFMAGMAEIAENSTRVGSFHKRVHQLEKAANAGKIDLRPQQIMEEAAIYSREASVDFSMHGTSSFSGNLRILSAFFNAGIQGTDQFRKALKTDPMGVSRRMAASITLPSVLLYMINRTDPDYQNLPDWERNIFWHFKRSNLGPIGDLLGEDEGTEDDLWFRFPKPFEPGILAGTLPERFLEWLDSEDPQMMDESAREILGELTAAYLPMPTVFQPIVENLANKSMFTGSPVTPLGMEGMDPTEMAGPRTSSLAKGLARMLNGDDEDIEGKISPIQVDHMIKGWTGGLGRLFLGDAVDIGVRYYKTLMGEEAVERPAQEWLEKAPMFRGFVSNYPVGNQALNDFYEVSEEARAASRTAAYFERSLQTDDYIDWVQKHVEALALDKPFQGVSGKLAKMQEMRLMIWQHPQLNGEEKRRMIRQLDEGMTRMANAMVEAAANFDLRPKEAQGSPFSLLKSALGVY